MILAWLLLACAVPDSAPVAGRPATAEREVADDPALERKIADAGRDTAKLMALARASSAAGQDADARKVWSRIVELEPDHQEARQALNHQRYDGKWFETFSELARYKRAEAARMKERGLVRWKEEWVPEADVPFLNMGWTRDVGGRWANPADLARAQEIRDLQAKGYLFRADDNSWVAPEEVQHWQALLWKCGEEWVDLARANEYHSKIETCWQLAGEHFTVFTTCDWEGGNAARWYADRTFAELVRLFGVQPAGKPYFVVLSSLEQYNQAAAGNAQLLADSEGYSSFHGAYFADLVFDFSSTPPQFRGTGVSFWDRRSESLRGWGPYWLRWAAAQSFVDAIDPSWGFIGETISSRAEGGTRPDAALFWREKRIPRWLRYGAASYVERYMRDPEAAEGANPWGLREFACADLRRSGGLRKLEEIFAFRLDINQIESSTRLYHEAGLMVAYLLDGAEGDAALRSRHAAFQAALKGGSAEEVAKTVQALQKELLAHERQLRAFAGL